MAVFFALFLRGSKGRMVALQAAKDYNIGQRYFPGLPVEPLALFFLFSLKYQSRELGAPHLIAMQKGFQYGAA